MRIMGKCVSRTLALLLIVSVLAVCLNVQLGRSNPATITVPDDYLTIQEAIDHANAGDTIFVRAGMYVGHIDVYKPITLKGESSQNTTLKVGPSEGRHFGLYVLASNVTISGFNITSDDDLATLVMIDGRNGICDNEVFTGNIIVAEEQTALTVFLSTGTRVSNNLVIIDKSSGSGVYFDSSHSCVVDNNTLDGGWLGIYIALSNNMLISNNVVTGQTSWENSGAITLMNSQNTTVVGNTVANNEKGIHLRAQVGDLIYRNNFMNNSKQVDWKDWVSAISWDDGYPLGGNYWSDYNGTDVYGGRYQNETGSDGIGDIPYVIDSGNRDNCPLMNPYWNLADVNRDLRVDIRDVLAVSRALGSGPSDPKWNPLCDVNNDLNVDIKDYYAVCKNYGKTYP
jgi:parallel beta-helix repeat protein